MSELVGDSQPAPPQASSPAELSAQARSDLTQKFYAGGAAGAVTLVVDDDSRNRFAMTALLERGGVTVVPAESGAQGVEVMAERSDIDLVLMDIMMPGMDGYEAMTAIRGIPRWLDLPIIAVTGKAGGSERERCIAAGATEFITKPIDTAVLIDAIGRWLPPPRHAVAG
jgi:CheY-like chemotaxis protein